MAPLDRVSQQALPQAWAYPRSILIASGLDCRVTGLGAVDADTAFGNVLGLADDLIVSFMAKSDNRVKLTNLFSGFFG